MCYTIYLSTDSPEDLSARNSERVRFERMSEPFFDPCTSFLEFTHQWYVGSESGCSCAFRHLTSKDLGFSEPVDWYPEEEQNLISTQELYGTLASLVSAGFRVDLIDIWQGADLANIATLDVAVDDVPATAFRMFENYKFRLTKEKIAGSA